MKIFKKIIEFYVFSNLHVSLSVVCLVLVSGKLFKKLVLIEALFLGCITFIGYHLIRYSNRFKYGKLHALENFSNQYKKIIWLVNGIAIVVSLSMLLKFQFSQLLKLLPFGILTLAYAFSFVKIKGKIRSIRYLPGFKIFIIALVWSGSIVFFPFEYEEKTKLYFIELLFFMIAYTLPFDIRDLNFDDKVVKTLPMILGIENTKYLGTTLLGMSIALHFYIFKDLYLLQYLIICIVVVLFLIKSTNNQSKYFCSLWVEGIPILYYLFCIV